MVFQSKLNKSTYLTIGRVYVFLSINVVFQNSRAVQDLEDVSKYPQLFAALLSTGTWTEEELEKLSGRNLIRVFKGVEHVNISYKISL